ncbi:MAG: hypothetical protein JRN15_01945 [Nitrososphaerota archaeon]|nr:hypothetical protein [Nitrososphaerota archaeon]
MSVDESKRFFMRKILEIVLILSLFSLCLIFPFFTMGNFHSSASVPPFAKEGAYALYSGNGGFVAFLSGASANISYYVYNVYPNGTMRVFVNVSLSLGTEVANGSTTVAENITDSAYYPSIMPAISPANLTGEPIVFQNITCTFVQNSKLTVPAGNFNATEYQGENANGTTVHYWFDRATGLSLEMVQPASYFQLIQSNIAIPLSTQTAIQSEIPFLVVFFVGWAGAGLFFYALVRHYTRKAKKTGGTKQEIPVNK